MLVYDMIESVAVRVQACWNGGCLKSRGRENNQVPGAALLRKLYSVARSYIP
jgi:hypothetical protein